MFFHSILLVVSVMTFLPSPHELPLACDQNCADKPQFTPSRLVVLFGKPASALCSVCQPGCNVTIFSIESPIGNLTKNGTEITWTVNNMTQWDFSPSCYYTHNTTNVQCCSDLPITVYQPPYNVSFSVHPDEPMSEGQQYTLQCEVRDVAPVENLRVTFYRGQTALGHTQSNNTDKKPVSEVFTWNITSTKEDNGVQFWCEAKLELGAEGPQPPPVGKSENVTAAVHYKPQREALPIIITEGTRLTLNCSSVGNPPPSYTWMPPSRITSPFNGSVFIIESITRTDEGSYTCSVSNVKGSITVEFNVMVQGLPSTTLPTTTTTSTPTTTKTTTATTTTTTTRTTPNRGLPSTTLPTTITPSTTMIITTSTPTTMITTTSTPTTTKTTTATTPTTTPNREPPYNVSFSVQPDEPMSEGQQYTLQCEVQDVAPVENLTVTFYRGQTVLPHTQSSNTDKKPVSEVFTRNITSTKEDDGVQFWCEAKLELGADGPQPPPVVGSEKLTAAVRYKPQLEVSTHPDPIIITEGKPLTLNCSSVGNPKPLYTWTLPSRINLSSGGSVFFINSITHKDEGSYTCYVSNEEGSTTVQFDVTVQANNRILIIGLVVAAVLLAVIVGVAVFISYHRYYKEGMYNLLWDRIHLHTTHSSIPTAE